MDNANRVCDIIVPIYNAYDDVLECVDSILRNTDKEEYRLILINDKSIDTRIEQYLATMESEGIIVINNEVNLGFVKTVNKGIKLSDNDVILLNSDTIVTKNWLTKIKACAYNNKNVATVTPLTNSGTICSVPNFIEDNVLPENFTLEEFSEMIELKSFKRYPVIATAVGFCTYIKRTVIDEIGILDEENFNKGYGEENDFCCRAIEHGYINVLCDDTYIYHKGSMSFKEDKAKYVEENLQILFKKYPNYDRNIQRFITQNPLKDIHENIKLYIRLHNNKKNILYIIHNGILKNINNPIGGTEFHLLDLVQNIDEYNKYVLVSTGKELILTAFVDKEVIEFKFDIEEEILISTFESDKYQKILEEIINSFKISIIHVQHTRNHILNIPKIAKLYNIPTVITLHDFYTICPTVNLLDVNGEYCEDTRSKEMCQKCIKNKIGYDTNFIETWNGKVRSVLKEYDKIIVPSKSAKDIIQAYYKDVNLNIEIIKHGTDSYDNIIKREREIKEAFNIAFLGGLAPYKGSGIIHSLILKNKQKDIKWHLVGNLGDQRLNLLERHDLVKYGRYERKDVGKILDELQIDLVCILSTWPETYSYTLTEAWQSGIPVLVTNTGALGERVKSEEGGWTVELGVSPEEILNKIYEIENNENDYNKKLNNVLAIKFKNKKEMAEKYAAIYSSLAIKENIHYKKVNPQNIYKAYQIANICNIMPENISNEANIEIHNKILQLESEINLMRNTIGWKLLNEVRDRAPRGVKILKKILYLVVKKGYK